MVAAYTVIVCCSILWYTVVFSIYLCTGMLDYVVYLPLAVPLSVERVKVTGTLLIPCFTIFRVATWSASLTVTSERLKVITTAVVQCEHMRYRPL